jgi:hypothetical protein
MKISIENASKLDTEAHGKLCAACSTMANVTVAIVVDGEMALSSTGRVVRAKTETDALASFFSFVIEAEPDVVVSI